MESEISRVFCLRKKKGKEVREPCIDLSRHLDAFRRHFLIVMVVIIKDRTQGRKGEGKE